MTNREATGPARRARIGVVVPAAGEGRRLGTPKALAAVGGVPFTARVVRAAAAVASDVVVVLGARAGEAAPLVPRPARVVVNDAWPAGRTGSVKAGLRALGPVDAFLVWPVDVPLAGARDAVALVHAFEATGRAAVPVHGNERGHPVLLPAALASAILSLGDDEPLHTVVRAADPVEVPAAGRGVLLDVNTPEDLARAERLLQEAAP